MAFFSERKYQEVVLPLILLAAAFLGVGGPWLLSPLFVLVGSFANPYALIDGLSFSILILASTNTPMKFQK